jgi:hypothetical protein
VAATVDQLAADARDASAAFHRARQDGTPEATVEDLLSETIFRYINLGRALAERAGLPVEHPFAAYNRARDHMIAERLYATEQD